MPAALFLSVAYFQGDVRHNYNEVKRVTRNNHESVQEPAEMWSALGALPRYVAQGAVTTAQCGGTDHKKGHISIAARGLFVHYGSKALAEAVPIKLEILRGFTKRNCHLPRVPVVNVRRGNPELV